MKHWYQSKTIWANILSAVTIAVIDAVAEAVQPYIELAVLAGINIVLRFITKERIK